MHKFIRVTLVVALMVAWLQRPGIGEVPVAARQESVDSFRCELTKANGRHVPDSPVPGKASAFYGNDSIAIGIGAEGSTITFRPGGAGFVLPDGLSAMEISMDEGPTAYDHRRPSIGRPVIPVAIPGQS